MPKFLVSTRIPFPIAVQRRVQKPLLVAAAPRRCDGEVRVRSLSPGTVVEVCDTEGEMALLRIHQIWYRTHLDDLMNSSVPLRAIRDPGALRALACPTCTR